MSCPKTQYVLMEYFDDSLADAARQDIERHIQNCQECSEELDRMNAVQSGLTGWRKQPVPHWDRHIPLFRHDRLDSRTRSPAWWLQWVPTAASLAMLVLLVFNVSITRQDDGFRIAFGQSDAMVSESRLEERLQLFAVQQEQWQDDRLQQFAARLDEQQAGNNRQLTAAVLDQVSQLTAENFDRIYTYFEQQRQIDLESMQVGYQQLLDSDFETLRTMEQLAGYIQSQGQFR